MLSPPHNTLVIMTGGTGKVPEANRQAGWQLTPSDGRALSTHREEESLLFLMSPAAQSIVLLSFRKNQSNNDSIRNMQFSQGGGGSRCLVERRKLGVEGDGIEGK